MKGNGSMARLGLDKIVQSVSALCGLSQKECRAVINDFIYVIRTSVLNGMEIELKGIGYFGLKYRPPKEPRLMPDVTKGGEMSWSRPKEEYNYPTFTMHKSFVQAVREITEGHAFKSNKKGNRVMIDMTPEDYEKFAKHLDEINFESEDFEDEDFVGQPRVERDDIYDRLQETQS